MFTKNNIICTYKLKQSGIGFAIRFRWSSFRLGFDSVAIRFRSDPIQLGFASVRPIRDPILLRFDSVEIRFGFDSIRLGSDSGGIRFGLGTLGFDSVVIRFGLDLIRFRYFEFDSVAILFGLGIFDSIRIRTFPDMCLVTFLMGTLQFTCPQT